jgi:LacI family transcriptional regulator
MITKRLEGYKQALTDHHLKIKETNIIACTNELENNHLLIKKLMQRKNRPDGIIATVEKLTISIYLVCKELNISIPGDVRVISFSNLPSASILNPSLTTITQPAFEMGKAAATILFKALEKPNFNLKKESLMIPSLLLIRESSMLT